MIKRIVNFLKKYMRFKLIEVPFAIVFSALIAFACYSFSTLPNERNSFVAREISLLSKKSKTGSVPVYFNQNSSIELENSTITRAIQNFNNYNNTTYAIKEYKELVCANLDDREVKVNALEDNSPAVIMTSWSTYYYDKKIGGNVFMSNLLVEGFGKEKVTDTSFCYITSKQADYLISQNPEFNTHEDLINTKIDIKLTFAGESKTAQFIIRDIILSDVGNDPRYNELFGSYIVCYYLPFLKTTKYQMLYDLAKDEDRNLKLLNEIKESYSPEKYEIEFLNGVDKKQADAIRKEYFNVKYAKNNTLLIVISFLAIDFVFAITIFFVCESYNETRLSLALLLAGIFIVEYILLYILVALNVTFAVKLFTSSGILFNIGFLLLILIVIGISAFVKENTKFNRKYVNEKHGK